MNRLALAAWIMVGVVLWTAGFTAAADEALARKGREVLKNNSAAVVTVTAAQKVEDAGDQEGEQEEGNAEMAGAIIDPSGLTVVAYSNLDPLGDQQANEGEDKTPEIKVLISDIKLHMADGTEVPAKLVMKDTDNDIAFIRPDDSSEAGKKFAGHYPCVQLEKIVAPQPLDAVFVLDRAGESVGRQICVESIEIHAITSKPRTYYIAKVSAGAVVFNAEGKLLGLGVTPGPLNVDENSSAIVVLPAGDIAELAKQAVSTPATNP